MRPSSQRRTERRSSAPVFTHRFIPSWPEFTRPAHCLHHGARADPPNDRRQELAQLPNRAGVSYALIGGVAVQIRTTEPRTTLDIDVAVPRFDDIPRAALLAAGFDHTGRHEHSDNWRAPPAGPGSLRTAVQFSAEDVGIADAVANAELTDLADGLRMRVATSATIDIPASRRLNSRPGTVLSMSFCCERGMAAFIARPVAAAVHFNNGRPKLCYRDDFHPLPDAGVLDGEQKTF
jgi:hypothetical protein